MGVTKGLGLLLRIHCFVPLFYSAVAHWPALLWYLGLFS
jgi:hypothetical protein